MNDENYSIGVTGASGFVGSYLVRTLMEQPRYSVVAYARKQLAYPAASVDLQIVGDICGVSDWSVFFAGLSCVVHTAARVHVMEDNSTNPLKEFRRVNLDVTSRMARGAAIAGVKRFIFISSIKVNGEETKPGVFFSPHDDPKPTDPYGISKMEAEQALRVIARETGMEVVIIRPVLVYGAGVKANFLNLLKLSGRGWPLPLASIENNRSFVSVYNLVDLIITCITHPNAANQTFLVSDDCDLSTPQLLRRMAKSLNKKILLLPLPSRLLELATVLMGKGAVGQRLCRSLQVDISKTKDLLNWNPIITVDEALIETANYLKEKV